MRTTLFFTAAFAAINFAFQASAVSIHPTTSIERSATELAQVEATLSTFIEADAEKDFLPSNLLNLKDMFNDGHSEYASD